MKILLYSPQFYPRLGGVERVTQILAQAWSQLGCEVKVVCLTARGTGPREQEQEFGFEVVRLPGLGQLLHLLHWCDVYVQSCISLKGLWPWLLVRSLLMYRPLVMIHHTWYCHPDGRLRPQDWLKLQMTRLGKNVAVSEAIAAHLPVPAQVIENPYAEEIFYARPDVERDRALIFVGRLVSDKGVDLLIAALGRLRHQGLSPNLTLVGAGPERPALEAQITQLNLAEQVTFAGELPPHEVAERLCQHHILVIPSRWQEPFGIVALEGLACGCWLVGSNQGGLTAAIGPGGLTYANGDVAALTAQLTRLLSQPPQWQPNPNAIAQHLQHHQQQTVAQLYLGYFQQ